MKRFLRTVPILCTLLLLGAGAFMPRLASLALDRQLENDVVLLENKNISLALEQETDFFRTLELFGSITSQAELSGGYRMKPEDAEAAAVEAWTRFAASGAAHGNPEVTPVLIASKTLPGLSGIFWRCIWRETVTDTPATSISKQAVLWLDDQSGKMVSFSGPVERSNLSAANSSFPQSAVDVAAYCRQHYPVDMVELTPADEDDPDGQFTITLVQSQSGQDEIYYVFMRIADGWLAFNDMMPF